MSKKPAAIELTVKAKHVEAIKVEARKRIDKPEDGEGAFHNVGVAQGLIEALAALDLLDADELNRWHYDLMVASADAEMADIENSEYPQDR